jgi:type III restriction enzyme
MKIQFDPDLTYQKDAVDAVVGIFEGQETCRTTFTVTSAPVTDKHGQMDALAASEQNDLGIGNRLRLIEEELLENTQQVQLVNGLKQSSGLNGKDFTIEMETGTGKTYVYLRSIFELNQKYGFTKFIIVVPSVAIKEGVYKSLQITEEHFRTLYDNTQFDYFVYDSSKREQVRSFATNDYIQAMVINIDAFRKSFTDPSKETKANLIHRADDRLSGMKPIEFIRSTSPIVIIDEPQSVDTTAKSKEAIASLNPLCTFRYSATHVDKHNPLYKLDSIDAYEHKLVKQIEVASLNVQDGHNKAYIKLLSVDNRKSPITAQIELDVNQGGGVKRIKKKVKAGDDLLEISKGRDLYDGYVINDIYCGEGNEYIDFTSKPEVIRLGDAIGGVDDDAQKRLQIRKTIEEHLEKELKMVPLGIKVLSLFFIDRVANYRSYNDEGQMIKGKYAQWFEEEYRQIVAKPKYRSLFEEIDLGVAPEDVHNGYFAADKRKKGDPENLIRLKDSSGKTADDESAYNLIMKEKEKLLSFDSKLRFIFSHSALREGWDNPNVFQICTLNETTSTIKKRQEIGRGLRLAVNQDGERIHGFDVNTLTVMANESYEDFVKQLQKEIEDEEGIRFGLVEQHQFANIVVTHEGEKPKFLGTEKSEKIWQHLVDQGYIDTKGKVQDKLKLDLKDNKVVLPSEVQELAGPISALLKKVSGGLNVKNKDDRTPVRLNKQVYLSDDFKELWDRIKHRTVYRVDFDPEALIDQCAKEIEKNLIVGRTRFNYDKAKIATERSGLEVREEISQTHVYDIRDYQLPDIVSYLQNETNLTRRSIVAILQKCDRLTDFKNNPQKFIDEVTAIIMNQMRLFIVDGIKYQKVGEEHFYAQELFEDQELTGYLNKNMLETQKSVYDHVVYDSDIEETFARTFEKSDDIKLYAKLPGWFKIDTPLGGYNPDWAVLVEQDGKEKLYFVVETKSSLFSDALRPKEQAKIDCGTAHFKALGQEAKFVKANDYDSFTAQY